VPQSTLVLFPVDISTFWPAIAAPLRLAAVWYRLARVDLCRSAKVPSEEPSPSKPVETPQLTLEDKLRRWARSAPPRQLLSLRKRQNKVHLGELANRLLAECGDQVSSPSDFGSLVSSLQPMEPLPDNAAFGVLYHDVRACCCCCCCFQTPLCCIACDLLWAWCFLMPSCA
jgi:hypothetical protein